MTDLKMILMSSAAAISLAAAPAFAQDATTPATGAADTQQLSQAAPTDRSFDHTYGENFAGLGDRNVEELIGTRVVNDAGEAIGDVDNFGLSADGQIVAIVGIGGFLGMGEHSVALPMDRLTFDGEQLLISGVTREQLEAMPEYNEGDAATFASDQTLRGGYEGTGMPGMTAGTAPTDAAGLQPSDNPANDQPMADAQEDVAAATEAEADAEMAEAESELEQVGEDVAQATDEAGQAIEKAGEEMAQTTEDAGKAVEQAGDQAAEDVAEATDEVATEAEQAVETAQGAEPMADQPVADTAEIAAADQAGWTEEMDTIFADIADRQIAELIGMNVASSEGEVVGEIDNFALDGENVVAIVGVGGFLGIGEHDVALSLNEMTFDGEKLVLSSLTEEQLREMPEYEDAEAVYLPEDGTLRSSYNQ